MHDKKYKMENKILKLSLTGTIIFTVVESNRRNFTGFKNRYS